MTLGCSIRGKGIKVKKKMRQETLRCLYVCKSMMDQEKRGRVDVKQRHQIKMGEYEEICFKKKSEFKRIVRFLVTM